MMNTRLKTTGADRTWLVGSRPDAPQPGRTTSLAAVVYADQVDCTGVLETAIAAALQLAAEAQQWEIVGQLARELEARRVNRVEGAGVPNAERLARGRRD